VGRDLHVVPVDVVDASDRVVEASLREERVDGRLVARIVVHLDGVVDLEVEILTQAVDSPPSALVGQIEIEPVDVSHRRVALSRGDVTVVGEADALEADRLGRSNHRPEEVAVRIIQ